MIWIKKENKTLLKKLISDSNSKDLLLNLKHEDFGIRKICLNKLKLKSYHSEINSNCRLLNNIDDNVNNDLFK
jgi:hypothetical protein